MRATDGHFLDRIRHCLGDYLSEEGPDDLVFSADCGTDKVLAGGRVARGKARLYFGQMLIFVGPSREEMAGRLVGGFRDLVSAYEDGFVRLRAAAVSLDGAAILLPSPPQPRLPALAGLLVKGGAGFLGDEMAFLDPVLHRVHGPGFPLLIDSDDIGRFPEVAGGRGGRRPQRPPEVVGGRTPRRPLPVGDMGGVVAEPTPLGRIVFPEFAPGEATRFESLARAEALFRLSEAVLNLHVWGDRMLVLAQQVLAGVPAERLVVGSLSEAADRLLHRTADVGGR